MQYAMLFELNFRFRVQTNGEIFSWNIYSRDWQPISRGPFCIESTPEEHVLITCIPKSDTVTK